MSELQQLAKPLLSNQIDAAINFSKEELGGLEYKDIVLLKKVFPKHQVAVLVKAIVVNALYRTFIFDILKVASCVERMLMTTHSSGPDLVEEMVVAIGQITQQKNYSFASKYAHFFIDSDLPVLDTYAEWMVSKHLGAMKSKNPKRYLKFTEDIETLKRLAGLTCSCAELDAYLWVAGEYLSWKVNSKLNISGDLRHHFERLEKDPESERNLQNLLGDDVQAPRNLTTVI
jgi:hypothetical protein